MQTNSLNQRSGIGEVFIRHEDSVRKFSETDVQYYIKPKEEYCDSNALMHKLTLRTCKILSFMHQEVLHKRFESKAIKNETVKFMAPAAIINNEIIKMISRDM